MTKIFTLGGVPGSRALADIFMKVNPSGLKIQQFEVKESDN